MNMAASRPPVEWCHFDVILLKSTAAILAAAMFVGDRTTASPSLAGTAAVVRTEFICSIRETWNLFQNWAADCSENLQTQYKCSTDLSQIAAYRVSTASVRRCERALSTDVLCSFSVWTVVVGWQKDILSIKKIYLTNPKSPTSVDLKIVGSALSYGWMKLGWMKLLKYFFLRKSEEINVTTSNFLVCICTASSSLKQLLHSSSFGLVIFSSVKFNHWLTCWCWQWQWQTVQH